MPFLVPTPHVTYYVKTWRHPQSDDKGHHAWEYVQASYTGNIVGLDIFLGMMALW